MNVETPSTYLSPSIFENHHKKTIPTSFFSKKKLVRNLATNEWQVYTTIILPKQDAIMVLKDSFQKLTDLDRWAEFQRSPYITNIIYNKCGDVHNLYTTIKIISSTSLS